MKLPQLRLSFIMAGGLLGVVAFSSVRADEPFFITGTSTGSQVFTVSTGASDLKTFMTRFGKEADDPRDIVANFNQLQSLSTLVNRAAGKEGLFHQLSGFAYTGSMTYLGIPHAITFSSNAPQTTVTINFAPIGLSKTFTAATPEDVDDALGTFFDQSGPAVMGQFLKAIAAQSAIGVSDGSPKAGTAEAAGDVFFDDAFTPTDELEDNLASANGGPAAKPRFSGLALGFNSGHFEAAGFDGTNSELSGAKPFFDGRLMLSGGASLVDVEGAKIYGVSLNLATPLRLRTMSASTPYNWRVTPVAGVGARVSTDLGDGGMLWQLGVSNTLDYKIDPKVVLGVVNQLTYHTSSTLHYRGYDFDPDINQFIAKNGLRLVTPLKPRVIGELFVVDTRFLKQAAVRGFETLGGSLAFRTTRNFNLMLAANYDTGDDYEAWSLGLSSAWRW